MCTSLTLDDVYRKNCALVCLIWIIPTVINLFPLGFRSVTHKLGSFKVISTFPTSQSVLRRLSVAQRNAPQSVFSSDGRNIFLSADNDDCQDGRRLGEAAIALTSLCCDGGREMRKRRRKRSQLGCCHDTGCRIIGRLIRFHHKALIACFRHDYSESSSYLQEQEQQQTACHQ